MLVGSTRVDVERGEWAVSIRFLGERWSWGRHKVDNYLKFLRDEGMIKMGTAEGTQQTVLTVCNYDTYNPLAENEGTAEKTPRGHRGDTEGTKKKKVRKKEDSSSCDDNNENISSSLNTNGEKSKKSWRNDFEIYLADVRAAYLDLIRDPIFLTTQQKFHPNVDIRLTLEKACVNFWATEAGWKHKLRQRSKEINWKTTLTNAISQPQNKVYKNEQRNNKTDNKPSPEYKADILRRLGFDPGTGEV